MITVECLACGRQFEVEPDILFLANRFHCSLCDALLEVIEEDPLILDVVEEAQLASEDEEDEDDEW